MADEDGRGNRRDAARPDRSGAPRGEARDAPRRWGPCSLATLLPPVTRPAFRRRSAASATLLTDWPSIVGPALAAVTAPRRFAGGVLVIGCDGPTALELHYAEARLRERINVQLGGAVVSRIRLVQDGAPAPPPGTGTAPRGPRPRPAGTPPPVPDAPDGPLGEALARLRAAMDAAAPAGSGRA